MESSQVIYAVLGPNVFYFLSAPMMRLIAAANPFERTALEFRRKAAIEYLGQSIFIDRECIGAACLPRPRAGCRLGARIRLTRAELATEMRTACKRSESPRAKQS